MQGLSKVHHLNKMLTIALNIVSFILEALSKSPSFSDKVEEGDEPELTHG